MAIGDIRRSGARPYKSEKSEASGTRSVNADVAAADMPNPNVAENAAVYTRGEASSMSSYDVWLYSILGAVVVGLSGIFPLLVIPLEAGPSLKHGGKVRELSMSRVFAFL